MACNQCNQTTAFISCETKCNLLDFLASFFQHFAVNNNGNWYKTLNIDIVSIKNLGLYLFFSTKLSIEQHTGEMTFPL